MRVFLTRRQSTSAGLASVPMWCQASLALLQHVGAYWSLLSVWPPPAALFAWLYRSGCLSVHALSTSCLLTVRLLFGYVPVPYNREPADMPPRSAKRTSCLAAFRFSAADIKENCQPSSDWVYEPVSRGVEAFGELPSKTNQVTAYTSTDVGTETEEVGRLHIHCR